MSLDGPQRRRPVAAAVEGHRAPSSPVGAEPARARRGETPRRPCYPPGVSPRSAPTVLLVLALAACRATPAHSAPHQDAPPEASAEHVEPELPAGTTPVADATDETPSAPEVPESSQVPESGHSAETAADATPPATPPQAPPPVRRGPNVLFILADDLAVRSTGFGGNPNVFTPHLDRLASEGVHFTRAYSPSGWCMPSRASILTGRYPHATGVIENGPQRTPDLPTWAGRLRELGWSTGVVGKWHSHNRDFDALGFSEHNLLPVPPSPGDYSAASERMFLVDGDTVFSESYVTDYFTDAAVDFLERHADETFALAVNYNAPHRSGPPSSTELWHFAEGFEERYDPASVELPASVADDMAGKPAYHRADRGREVFDAHSPAELARALAQYRSLVSELDAAVGRVLAKLDELGLADDTIVVFSSDNGIFLGEHGMLLKGSLLYEEQVHVPLLVRAPGTGTAGRSSDAPVNLVDLAPTLLELVGGDPDPGWQGESLVPRLRAPAADEDAAVFLENGELRGLVTRRWKLVDAEGVAELYDLETDPFELVDLGSSPEHADVVASLQARLWAARRRTLDDRRLP